MGLEWLAQWHFCVCIGLDTAIVWLKSKERSEVTRPHHIAESISAAAVVDNGMGLSCSSSWEIYSYLTLRALFLSSDYMQIQGHEAGFNPCSEHCLTCSCSVLWDIYTVFRFAPETVEVSGSLSSNVCELLIHHRVKSRTRDLSVLECHCLYLWWLCQHRKTYLAAICQQVIHCRAVKEVKAL